MSGSDAGASDETMAGREGGTLTGTSSSTRAPNRSVIAGIAISAVVAACSPSPYILGDFNHPGTPAFVCQAPAATTTGTCSPQGSTNEADWQKSGTVRSPVRTPLFAECTTGVQRLLIKDPGSSSTQIVFECAPPPINIGTAGPSAAAHP